MNSHCWRVKLYLLEGGGVWNDQGTGFVACEQYSCDGSSDSDYLIVRREENNSILLQSPIQYEDAYERQGESIIMWREKCAISGKELDYALSFENTAGCYAIWDAINNTHSYPCKLSTSRTASHESQNHGEKNNKWLPNNGTTGLIDELERVDTTCFDGRNFGASSPPSLLMPEIASSYIGLPSVSLECLDEIKEKILGSFPSQKEVYASIVREHNGAYLQKLLQLSAELLDENDLPNCHKIAEIVRGFVYLNDVELLDVMVKSQSNFFLIASAMEWDPLLKEKGKFKDILTHSPNGPPCIIGGNFGGCKVEVDDKDFRSSDFSKKISSGETNTISDSTADIVTKLFRTRLLKDCFIRPLPDESGATALNSLLHSLQSALCERLFSDTAYLQKVLNLIDSPSVVVKDNINECRHWMEHVEQEFGNENSRNGDRSNNYRGDSCSSVDPLANIRLGLCFLRELFYMSRQLSIEQRSELYSRCLNKLRVPFFTVLRNALCLRNDNANGELSASASIRIAAAEILSSVTHVCPAFLRQTIIEGATPAPPPYCRTTACSTNSSASVNNAADYDQNDRSILFVIIERICCDEEASVVEHLGETVKVLLDPERLDKLDKDRFLGLFFDYYAQWMLLPFVHDTIHPDEVCATSSCEVDKNKQSITCTVSGEQFSAISSSRRFICEILSLCASSHTYMKNFVVRNNVILRVLKLLKSRHKHMHIGAIKFVRAIVSVKADFYNKHIVKYDAFKPLFELFKSICMKDNLVTSVMVELIDYIRSERIEILICYIVEKYRAIISLCLGGNDDDALNSIVVKPHPQGNKKLLYTEVFQKFLRTYEQLLDPVKAHGSTCTNFVLGVGPTRIVMNKNLAEIESEEAYFREDSDDDGEKESSDDASSNASSNDGDEYGPFLHSSVIGSASCSKEGESGRNTFKRSYFEDLGNIKPHTMKDERTIRKSDGNSNSLKLISEMYCEEQTDEAGLKKVWTDKNSENSSSSTNTVLSTVVAPNGVSSGRFCYSPPLLPPLKSKFEQDSDEHEDDNSATARSGNPFLSSKVFSRCGIAVSPVNKRSSRVDKESGSSSSGGRVKFSLKKKPVRDFFKLCRIIIL